MSAVQPKATAGQLKRACLFCVLEVSMSKASGIVLIAVGIGVAAYAMPYHNGAGDQQPTQDLSTAKAPTELASIATAMAVTTPKALPEVVQPEKPAGKPAKDAAAAEPRNPTTVPAKPSVVATSPRAYERPAPVGSNAAAIIPGDRDGLTRELQRELRRVGCYDGAISGTWSPASRRAMKAFTDRVNASLPIDQPDYILLRLLQSSSERVCGVACRTGEGMSGDGRCLPGAVIAQAAKKTSGAVHVGTASRAAGEKPAATTSTWSTTTTVATRNMPVVPEGRMALAGPGNESAAARQAGGGRSAVAAVTQTPDAAVGIDQTQDRGQRTQARSAAQRKTNLASVDNSRRRYEAAPRNKFGPGFFRQREIWGN
jgi:hypothetical protein